MARTHRICVVPGCGNAYCAKGYCRKHYTRLMKYGDPNATAFDRGAAQAALHAALSATTDDCIIWQFHRDSAGYGRVTYQGQPYRTHRLVCQLTHGDPPSSAHEAAHECGNGHLGCCNPRHLSWKTPLENSRDKHRHGTMPRGETAGRAKLSEAEVREIRRRAAGADPRHLIWDDFNITRQQAQRIVAGTSWAWLK